MGKKLSKIDKEYEDGINAGLEEAIRQVSSGKHYRSSKILIKEDDNFQDFIVEVGLICHSAMIEYWEASYPKVRFRLNEDGLKDLKKVINKALKERKK